MTKTLYEMTFMSEVEIEKVLDAIVKAYPKTMILKKPGTMNKYIIDVLVDEGEKNE